MPMDIQHLRCKVNFQALDFVPHIRALGDSLISRLRNPQRSSEEMNSNYLQEVTNVDDNKNAGKFVVLHLRFDKVFIFLSFIIIIICTYNVVNFVSVCFLIFLFFWYNNPDITGVPTTHSLPYCYMHLSVN